MRKAAEALLPEGILQRKKMGFPSPPKGYDRHVDTIIRLEDIENSTVLQTIFRGNDLRQFWTHFSLRDQYFLYALVLMEQEFFA